MTRKLEWAICVPEMFLPDRSSPSSFSGTMQHDGREYGFGPANIISDRFHKWVELDVPAISAKEDNLAVFIWHFNRCPGMGIGVDRLRNYRRSTYILEGNTKMAFDAEAAMEMQWYK